MPIQAPTTITGAAAGEFKETTAAFRKTGPVEKYPPVSQHIKTLMLNGMGPAAPRVDELAREGKAITTTTLRAVEVAAKLQRGEDVNASEVAQMHIAVREALDVGLTDENSPYFQANAGLRAQRANELSLLNNELMGYLTQEARRPEDVTVTERRWRIPFVLRWPPVQWLRHNVDIVQHGVRPKEDRPLTPGEIAAAETQSRIVETYDQARRRITQERYGTHTYASLSPREKRLVTYATSEELSRQFDDGRVREILDEIIQTSPQETLDDALESGTPPEKALAKRVQKMQEDREGILRRSKDLAKVRTMAEFQRFLGVGDDLLTQGEITEIMINKLGLTDQRQINALKSRPDNAFRMFFQQAGPLGTATFVGELFKIKLEQFAENRGITPKPAERAPGAPLEHLSKDALIGLSPAALALQLVDGKLTTDPVKYLTDQGIPSAEAEKMVKEAVETKKFAIKNPDGTYRLDHDKLGEWGENELAVLAVRGILNMNDVAVVTDLRTKMDTALTADIADAGARGRECDRRINSIKDLAKIKDPALPPAEQQRLVRNWDKRSLALLVLLFGPAWLTRFTTNMATNDQRAFQNMFE